MVARPERSAAQAGIGMPGRRRGLGPVLGVLDFSEWLRTQLKLRRMSQRHLAWKSGVDRTTISRIISGGRTPSLETAVRLMRALREKFDGIGLRPYFRREGQAADHAMARARTASRRELMAAARDEAAALRDARAELAEARIISSGEPSDRKLSKLKSRAAGDRAKAALDRRSAASDRATAAAELEASFFDDLTGAYRREMGNHMLSNEIARARRADGRFVVAFIDVDGLKGVNDGQGHAAGDQVLRTVVETMRSRLRSFDPILRYGGDEFVCALGGTDIGEASRRFGEIRRSLQEESISISVGFASLETGESQEGLIARADAALLEVKRRSTRRRRLGESEGLTDADRHAYGLR